MEENNQQNQKKFEKEKVNFPDLIFVIRLIIGAVLIILLIWGVALLVARKKLQSSQPNIFLEKAEKEKTIEKEDSISAINQDLEKVEIIDLEQEFKKIDEDLNYL